MNARPSDKLLRPIVEIYRSAHTHDSEHRDNGARRQSLTAIAHAARSLLETMSRADQDELRSLGSSLEIGDTLVGEHRRMMSERGSCQDAVSVAGRSTLEIALAAEHVATNIPDKWRKSASDEAALSLAYLFEQLGLEFTGSIEGLAVKSLLRVAKLAGDEHLHDESARKYIHRAIRDKSEIDATPVPR